MKTEQQLIEISQEIGIMAVSGKGAERARSRALQLFAPVLPMESTVKNYLTQ